MKYVIKKLMWADGTEVPYVQLNYPFKEKRENKNAFNGIDRLDIVSALCTNMVLDNIQYCRCISSRRVWLENRQGIQGKNRQGIQGTRIK